MTQDTKLQQLVINKLTTAQYQAALNAGTIDPNQLYMTTDSQTLRDVTVGGSSIVSNNTAALGTMALETASNYSTKAVADTLYAQKALETTVAGKLDKISTASKVYGTDVNGNQTSYDITSFGNVDDVKVGTTSVVANKIATLGTMAGQPTTNYYTKTEIDGKLSAGMHYKGTVASYSNLPSSDNQVGDLYNVTDTGSNYAWDGTAWDKLSENIDLSGVVPNTRTINGKELSTNITLTASDVNALPSSTVIPTVDQTYNASSSNAQSGVAINGAGFIRNTATGTNALTILGTPTNSFIALNIGFNSSASGSGATALGSYAFATGDTNTFPLAVGYHAYAKANGAIQIGTGENNTARTLQIGFYINNTDVPYQWTLLDGATGLIPDARISTNIARTSQIPSASDLLPSQSGQNGKFLTTNGTTASWEAVSQPSIATTSTAGLVKPDGTSITVDANGTISSAGGVDIDEETITKNSNDELQVVAIVNPNTNNSAISPLKIWNGTEQQWTNGEATTWNYWQTSETSGWTAGGNLPNTDSRSSIAYGNGVFVTVSWNSNKSAYSTDGGQTWTAGGTLPTTSDWASIAYGNGRFVTVTQSLSTNKSAYSTDGGQTWTAGGNLPSTGYWLVAYNDNGVFVAVAYNSNKSAYSTDGGQTWTAGGTLPGDSNAGWFLTAGGGIAVTVISSGGRSSAYSTDGGQTWTAGGTLPANNSSLWKVVYGNNRFLAYANNSDINKIDTAYSTDGGQTWTAGGALPGKTYWSIAYGDGKFVAVSAYSSNISAYSTDGGATWHQSISLSANGPWYIRYGDGKFVSVRGSSTDSAIFTVTYDKCYTLDSTPTTSSQVYSAPETPSTKTITSVGSGTITLSDNLVYNSMPTGNQNTYRTLGAAHPDWLCNINNVGVKIGNTIIATSGGGSDIEEITDSEIEELWEE